VNLGQRVQVDDSFRTSNQFYGAQIGGRFAYRFQRLTLEALSKVAFGSTHQRIEIGGNTTLLTPGGPTTTASGGLLAVPSNSGTQKHDAGAVAPEVGVNLAYELKSWLRLRVGYSFLYLSSVVRPGNQIDRGIDPTQVPSLQFFTPGAVASRPEALFNRTDFWAQGVNLGMELQF
jgi:hypothetical protein